MAVACGALFQWCYNGDCGWIYNGSCGADPSLSTVASGILCYVWWTNPIGINGRRAGGKLAYSWHAMEIRQRQSRCAENGLIDRSPTTLVGTLRTYSHRRGRRRSMGRGSGGCMGREGGENLGFTCVVRSKKNRKCCCYKENLLKLNSTNAQSV